jgi:hypothetical protein
MGQDVAPTYRIERLTDKGWSSELGPTMTSALHMTLSRINVSTIILRLRRHSGATVGIKIPRVSKGTD